MHITRKINVATKSTWLFVALAAAMSCRGAGESQHDAGAQFSDASVEGGAGCEDGTIVKTSSDCLQDEAFCRELADGRYCTGPQTPRCPEGAIALPPDQPCPRNMVCWPFALSIQCARPADAPNP